LKNNILFIDPPAKGFLPKASILVPETLPNELKPMANDTKKIKDVLAYDWENA